jgi:single-strand DNA-binding protein
MAKGYTLVVVEGSLGRDPEAKSTPNGTKVATFSLGFERGFGEKAHTCWIDCVCFKDQAEFAEKWLKKGKSVRVVGELDVRSWDDKQTGAKRYKTEVVADKIQFVDSSTSASGGSKSTAPARQAAAPPTRQQVAPQTRAEADPFADDSDDPF